MRELINGSLLIRRVIVAAAMTASIAATLPANAQSSRDIRDLEERIRRLEQQLPASGRGIGGQPLPGGSGEEAANLHLRILKLEQIVEQLTGQIEEARFKANQTSTQLEALSNDMNYRLSVVEQTLSGGQAPPPGQAPALAQPARPQAQQQRPAAPSTGIDPLDPNAPLSRPMATPPSSFQAGGLQQRPQTAPPYPPAAANPPPITDGSVRASQAGDNTFGSLRVDETGRALPADPNQPTAPAPVVSNTPPVQPAPQRAPNPAAVAGSQITAPGGDGNVKLPEGTPKQQYDFAFDLLRRQDYPKAETAFREFIKRYPKDPLAGNAQYWLGETHYVRGDYQKAAVEFMSGYQNYPKSNKAPDNLLKLGMAMSNIGQTQGACTALGRLTKEYPDAGDQIRRSVTAERQRLKCQ